MTGKYVTLDIPWYETRILNCTFCGKMVAGRFWQDDGYPADKFCDSSCADVKRRLARMPRRRPTASPRRKRAGGG